MSRRQVEIAPFLIYVPPQTRPPLMDGEVPRWRIEIEIRASVEGGYFVGRHDLQDPNVRTCNLYEARIHTPRFALLSYGSALIVFVSRRLEDMRPLPLREHGIFDNIEYRSRIDPALVTLIG